MGWRVITVWECELREPENLAGRLDAALGRKQLQIEKYGGATEWPMN